MKEGIENRIGFLHHAIMMAFAEWVSSHGWEYHNQDFVWVKDGVFTNTTTSIELLEMFLNEKK